MKAMPKPVRIEPAFADREQIRAMFERYSPYRGPLAQRMWTTHPFTEQPT
jgi:3-methyladenine DNA glycosylase/8-oxoguanine DNA glycosylase